MIILLLLVSAGFPLLVTISTSLQSHSEVYASSPVLLPAKPQWHNYVDAMQNGNWGRYLFNSAYVTLWTLVLSLAINSMAGYALARIRFRGRAAVLALTLAGLMIPPQVTMIPVFTMLRSMPLAGGNDLLGQGGTGLMNTYGGLILPYIAGSFGVFLMRQFYVSFPTALDDAARIVLLTGFMGAFTTFSTFLFDSDVMLRNGDWGALALNLVGQIVLGLAALRAGAALAMRLV